MYCKKLKDFAQIPLYTPSKGFKQRNSTLIGCVLLTNMVGHFIKIAMIWSNANDGLDHCGG